MIALNKRHKATKCSDHRTMRLIAHPKTQSEGTWMKNRKENWGCTRRSVWIRRGRGTRDTITMLRITSERTSDIDRELFASFTNCQKTSDRVNGRKLV
jgi:hypothetical protein